MPFNTAKCVVLHFGSSNKQFDYYTDNHKLDVVNETKDLGITISCTLKPATQCQQAYARASGAWVSLQAQYPTKVLKYCLNCIRQSCSTCKILCLSLVTLLCKRQSTAWRYTALIYANGSRIKSLPYEERWSPRDKDTGRTKESCRFTTGVQALQGMVIYSIWSLFHCQYCYEHSRPYCKD